MSIKENYKISYAQNREDVIIEAFFPDVDKGFYVDVGANDPEDDSVTKIFYDRGWQGINIEPSPALHQKLVSKRKRDQNILVGIANKPGKLKFREYDNHGLSTFSAEMKQDYEEAPSKKTRKFTEYEVSVKPLSKVLDEIMPGHIHFLKVDVEGFEYEVLESNNWGKYRPELICIEANHIIRDWHSILKKANYDLVFNDGLNEYFLAREAVARKKAFNYAESIVLNKPIINPGLAQQLVNYENVQLRLVGLERELSQIQQELTQVISQRNTLFSQLQQYTHLRSQIKMLLINFRKAYRSRLEKLKGPTKLKRVIHLRQGLQKTDSLQKLSQITQDYDKKALRETRVINGRIRRAIYRLLDGLDRASIKLVKVSLRIFRKLLRETKYLASGGR